MLDCPAVSYSENTKPTSKHTFRRKNMEKLHRFEDQVVVITGASRGIGEGIALRFAEEGANVVVAANEEIGRASCRERVCHRV